MPSARLLRRNPNYPITHNPHNITNATHDGIAIMHLIRHLESTMRTLSAILGLLFILAILPLRAENKPTYHTQGQCDGFPKLQVRSAPDICLGLVASGFTFPRGILPLKNGDVLVVDMGGWAPKKGSIWRLHLNKGQYERTQLANKLDRPHGITLGPDGNVYLGVVGGIKKLSLENKAITDLIGGMSDIKGFSDKGRHPLVNLVFDQTGNLYVNLGSATDNCETPTPIQARCEEAEGKEARGIVRRYTLQWPAGTITKTEIFASGLRNSVALAFHPRTQKLWQGENSRDHINIPLHLPNDADLPHDEINQLNAGQHYGWPYCYDNNQPAPEFPKTDCRKRTPPALLLPGHAAPLGMLFYTGTRLPRTLMGQLIVGFHGYRENGHRIVAYPINPTGVAQNKPQELIYGWDATATNPMGAPVDLKQAPDGSIWISDDRNGSILRLSSTGPNK